MASAPCLSFEDHDGGHRIAAAAAKSAGFCSLGVHGSIVLSFEGPSATVTGTRWPSRRSSQSGASEYFESR
jgi:hypothetical protein